MCAQVCNLYQRISAIPFFSHVSFFGRGVRQGLVSYLPAGVLRGDVVFLVEDWCDHGPGECVLDLFSCKRGMQTDFGGIFADVLRFIPDDP